MSPTTDQRRHRRAETPDAQAVCQRADFRARFWVDNLSLSGALLRGTRPLTVGDSYDLTLSSPGVTDVVVRIEVVRVHDDGDVYEAVGVAFVGPSAEAIESITRMMGLAA